MSVNGFGVKNLNTNPTEVSSALARHMVTSLGLLGPYIASGTLFEAQIHRQLVGETLLLFRIVLELLLGTSQTFMRIFVARTADRCEAGRAMDSRGLTCSTLAIDLTTVWSPAVLIIIGLAVDVMDES